MLTPGTLESAGNLILASLPDEDRRRIARFTQWIDLPIRHALFDDGEPISHVYFPTAGLTSIVCLMASGDVVETMITSVEGFIGTQLLSGEQPDGSRAFQQIAGRAMRMSADHFLEEAKEGSALRAAAMSYIAYCLTQVSQLAACNRLHDASARCARWLLSCRERVRSDELVLTQEFLGQMLGIGRPSVTMLIQEFERVGAVTHSRGKVHVVDETALLGLTCECFGIMSRSYQKLVVRLQQPAKLLSA